MSNGSSLSIPKLVSESSPSPTKAVEQAGRFAMAPPPSYPPGTCLDFLKNTSSQQQEGSGSAYFSNGFVETAPRAIPFAVSNLNERCASSSASLRNQQMTTVSSWLPRPAGQRPSPASDLPCHISYQTRAQTSVSRLDPPRNESNALLTIFYAGNVNVYDNISTLQAQAIMHMASGSVAKSTPFDAAVLQSRPASPQDDACDKPHCEANMQHPEDRLGNRRPEFLVASPLLAPLPLVPRALPQARKASLARFLEKRKERVLSKCPFSATKPGEGTSSNHSSSFDKCPGKSLLPAEESPNYMSVCDSLSATGS